MDERGMVEQAMKNFQENDKKGWAYKSGVQSRVSTNQKAKQIFGIHFLEVENPLSPLLGIVNLALLEMTGSRLFGEFEKKH